MKLRLPHKLQAALMAALASVSFTTLSTGSAYAEETPLTFDGDAGKVLFMGDSITHGVADASYRWQLFKTFVDNGVYFSIDGPISGYYSTPADGDNTGGSATYRGVGFVNEHYAKASGRSYEMINGTSRYNNISVATLGQTYDISTGSLLIGTNDLLSDGGYTYDNFNNKMQSLLGGTVTHSTTGTDAVWTWQKGSTMGNLGTIIDSMKLDAGDEFYVLSVPTWTTHDNNNDATIHAAVAGYNGLLEQWVNEYNATTSATVKIVNVNQGLVDVTSAIPFFGNKAFFNNGSDGLHPSEQGSLIMAGNVARTMGIGGRTAGLVRSAATEDGWSQAPAAITFNPGGAAQTVEGAQFTVADGYTVDFTATFGNGSTDGWLDADKNRPAGTSVAKLSNFSTLTNSLNIQVGDGTHTGTLKLAEGYVAWSAGNGDMVLYCQDNSVSGNEALRIAYREADSANNILGGYYVWKGDMLIGQGLASVAGSLNGISLSIAGSQNVGGTISNLSWADTAYAPTTELFSSTPLPSHDNETAASLGIDFSTPAAANGRYGTNDQPATGNLVLQRTGGTESNGWFGPVGAAHTGDVLMKYSGLQISNNANIISVINGSVTNGNVAIVLDDCTHVGKGHYGSTGEQSIHGVYGQSLGGALKVEVNNATLDGGILMGVINGNGSISGGTQLIVNKGAAVGGSVYGGGLTGTVSGGTSITITGGSIAGSVYGAGMGGTVNGDSVISITGGVIAGDVIGGAQGGTFNGTSSVTITGNLPYIGGNITADTVMLTGVNSDPDHSDTFDKYRGTITADTIVLDDYKVEKILANLVTQSLVLQGGTNVTIHNLNLTACEIETKDTSSATLDGTLTLGNTATYTGNVTLADGLTIDMAATGETSGGAFSDGENGFIVGGEVTVMQRGTSGTLTLDTAKLTGAGVLSGSTFTYDATSGALTAAVQGETDTYYVNTGTVVYGGTKSAKDITSAVTVELRPTVSATLELADNLSAGCTGGIVVAQNAVGANIKIDSAVTLNASQLHANGAVALQGDGTYKLADGTRVLTSNISLGSNWTGAVELSGNVNGGHTFQDISNNNSFVKLAGVSTWIQSGGTVAANLMLDGDDNGSKTGAALDINGADNNKTYTFSGKVKGDGDIAYTQGGGNTDPRTSVFKFTGDISQWTGDFVNYNGKAGGDHPSLRLEGAGAVVMGGGIVQRSGGALDVYLGGSNTSSVAVNGNVVNEGGALKLTINSDTTFGANVTGINGLTVSNGKHVTLNGTTSFADGAASTIGGTIYNNGAMTLAGTATTNLSGNESSFELYTGSGSTNTYDGAGGFEGNGHLTSETAQYYIIKGGVDSSLSGAFEGTSATQIDNNLVMSGGKNAGLYYVNSQVTYGSAVAENTTGYVVADGATFTVGSDVGTVLSTTTGTGTFVVSETATLDAAPYNTAYAGTLKVASGKTLQIGGNTGHNMNLGTIGAVELGSGSTLSFSAQYATLNDVSVDSGTATIKFLDTKTEGTEALRLTGTTRIDSGKILSLQSEWKATMTIEKLAGEGTLKIEGYGHNEGRAYTINGSDGKFGTITLSGFKSDTATRRAQLVFAGDTQLTTLQTATSDTPKGTDVIVNSGATVSVDNFDNGWGLENLQVDGILNVSGELKYATGAGSQNIKGSGVINTAALKVGNAGGYVLDGTNGLVVNIGSGGIANSGSRWGYTTTLKNGVTLGATADWTSSEALNLSGTAIINTQEPTSDTGHNVTLSGVLSGTGKLLKDGAGTLTLSGANTFTVGIDVSAGTLKLGNQAGFGSTNQTITVGENGTVDLNGQIDANYTYTLAGGTLTNSGNAIPDTNSQTKGLVLTADSTVNAESGHDFRLLASSYDPTSLQLDGNTLAKTGGGQFELRNTTVNAGTIDVKAGSILFKDSNNKTGSVSANVKLSGGNVTGTMNLSGDISMTAEAATTTSVAIAAGNHTLTFDGSENLTESGAISGSGASVVKNGAGTLTLSGNNSYTGGTTINDGTLIAASANALGSGPVVVNADGTLELTSAVSSISGNMNVGQGGTLKLAGMDDTALSATGTFALGSNSILDLTGLTSIAGTEESITLVKGGIIDDTYLSSVDIKFATEIQGAQLEKQGNNLVLTFAPLASELIWDGMNGTAWDSGMNWHADGAEAGTSAFSTGNDVKFVSTYTNNVTQNGDVNAGTMTIDAGTSVTVNTSGHDLTVSNLVGTSTSNLTKTGAGTATFGGDAETAVSLGDLAVNEGTANFTGGPVTANKFTTSGNGTTVSFDEKVTVTGSRVEINYSSTVANESVTFAKGLDYTGTDGYALLIGNGNTVTLGGESNFNGKTLGMAGTTGKVVLLEDATLSLGRVYNSNTADNNGTIELQEGAKMTVTGAAGNSTITNLSNAGMLELHKETTIASGFTNTGTVSVVGDSASSMGKLNVNNNDQSLNMGNISLTNAELYIGSEQESRVRNIGTLTVDGTAKLTQKSWNSFIHIDALNNGDGSGDRSFTWQMDTNHWSNSIMYLDGTGDFDGTFTASRGSNGGNGAYQGHVQMNNQKALQNAVLEVNGANASNIMSVALNSDTVETRGLQGNANAILYAGEADATQGSSGDKRGTNAPESSKDAVLAINVDSGKDFTYAGKVETRVGVTKTGAGSQSFTGDLSGMNGAVTASAGALTLDNSSATKGNLASATVDGGTLALDNMNVTGAITLSSGTLDLLSATSTGSLSMTGGTLVMDNQNWLTSTGNLAFTSGTLDLTGMDIQAGNNYILATTTGGTLSMGSVDFTLSDSSLKNQFTLEQQGSSLVLTFTQPDLGLIWDGTQNSNWSISETDLNWHNADEDPGSAAFTANSNVTFESAANAKNTTVLQGDITAGTMTVQSGANVTVETNDHNLTAGINVAQDASVTFKTSGSQVDADTISGTISGAGDIHKDGDGTLVLTTAANTNTGTLVVDDGTVLVGNVGALGTDGNRNVVVNTGGTLAFDSNGASSYTVDTLTLNRGSVLTFSGEGELSVGTLNLYAESTLDLTNIALNQVGDYVLANVTTLNTSKDSRSDGTDLIEFVSMTGINGDARQADRLVTLHYKNNQLVLTLNEAHTGFYWKPTEDDSTAEGTWDTTSQVWYNNKDYSGSPNAFPNKKGAAGGDANAADSVFFLDAGEDGVENIVLDFPGVEHDDGYGDKYYDYPVYIRDLIIAGDGDTYNFTTKDNNQPYYINLDTNRVSNYVVREGATANFNRASINSGKFDVIHIYDRATSNMEDIYMIELRSLNNEGTFNITMDGALGGGGGQAIIGHVDNTGVASMVVKDNGTYIAMMIGEIINREGARMSLAAQGISADSVHGDGYIHNEGELIFEGSDYGKLPDATGAMYIQMPVEGSGTLQTIGSDASVMMYATVQQNSMLLGAELSDFSAAVTITDTTELKAAAGATATARFHASSDLGEHVKMGANTTLDLNKNTGATPVYTLGEVISSGEDQDAQELIVRSGVTANVEGAVSLPDGKAQIAGGGKLTIGGAASTVGELAATDGGTAVVELNGTTAGADTPALNATKLSNASDTTLQVVNTGADSAKTSQFNIGDATPEGGDYKGTLQYGVGANAASGSGMDLVIKDNNVAAGAVLEAHYDAAAPANGSVNIIVDTDHARVLGLSDNISGPDANRAMVVSGTEGANNKILEITGDSTYTYAGKLGENLDITYSGDGSQTIEGGVSGFNGKVTVDNGSAAGGVLALLNAASVEVTDVTLGANDKLGVYNGSTATGTIANDGSVTMTNGHTLTAGKGSAMDAVLEMKTGSTLDVSASAGTAGLLMGGSVTLNQGVTLSNSDMEKIMGMSFMDSYDLFSGVQAFSYDGSEAKEQAITFASENWVKASDVFSNNEFTGKDYYVFYSGNAGGGQGANVGAVYIMQIPEPASGTLSLLALAALAARRRRK